MLEQIAGDELLDWRSATVMTEEMKRLLKATGFLRVAADDTNQGVLNTPDIRYGILQRTVQTFSSNVLGLTIGCAQCHDHKYDPISQLDYYRLTALFTPAFNPQRWLKPAERSLSEVSPAEKEVIAKNTKELENKIKPFLRKLNAIYHIHLTYYNLIDECVRYQSGRPSPAFCPYCRSRCLRYARGH